MRRCLTNDVWGYWHGAQYGSLRLSDVVFVFDVLRLSDFEMVLWLKLVLNHYFLVLIIWSALVVIELFV